VAGDLRPLTRDAFSERLARAVEQPVSREAVDRLWIHYGELVRWNRRLSLIGPGTLEEAVERHYAESLAALGLLEGEDRVAVDVGSGAGFPGWVLAAARPELTMTLIDSRQRKWSFLSQVSQKAALPCQCLNARVTSALPEGFPPRADLIVMRAVRLGEEEFSALASRLPESGRFLLWVGERPETEIEGFEAARSVSIRGTTDRRIVEWVRQGSGRQGV
jgi:16S rRNA (guanine527-N7)-methyltransferase